MKKAFRSWGNILSISQSNIHGLGWFKRKMHHPVLPERTVDLVIDADAGYFDGIGRVNIPFIGAVGHITLRVILSWIFVSQFQLNAVAVATGIGLVLVNLFWSICYLKKRL